MSTATSDAPRLIALPMEMLTIRDRTRAETARRPGPWYRIENAADAGTADVWIYDEIAFYAVSAQKFVQDLAKITAPRITLHLNTPGGDVFDAIAIYNALRSHPAVVTTRVEGIAASAGSLIAMAGERILMAPHATIMIHDAWGATIGNAADHRKQADVLDKISDEIASVYAERAGESIRAWRDRMLEETWLSDQEAVDIGLADEIDRGAEPAKNRFDLSVFKHPPADLASAEQSTEKPTLSKRSVEETLRDVGLSQRDAKAFVAGGWAAVRQQWDVADEEEPEPTEEDVAPETSASTGMVEDHARRLAAARWLELEKLRA